MLHPLVNGRGWGRRLRATAATDIYVGAPPRRRENSGLGRADRLSEVPLVLLSSLSLFFFNCKMKATLTELGSILRLRGSLEKELRNSRWWHLLCGREGMLLRSSDARAWGAPSGRWLFFQPLLLSPWPHPSPETRKILRNICLVPSAGRGAGILGRKPFRAAGELWEHSRFSFGGESSENPKGFPHLPHTG